MSSLIFFYGSVNEKSSSYSAVCEWITWDNDKQRNNTMPSHQKTDMNDALLFTGFKQTWRYCEVHIMHKHGVNHNTGRFTVGILRNINRTSKINCNY